MSAFASIELFPQQIDNNTGISATNTRESGDLILKESK